MAVIRHNIIFGGVDSADYGIHIGGEGTFNAPKRAVETYSIPGRNGDLILDGGHFENVELVYTAFNYEKDLHTFAQNLSDFRNALAAQKGYQKLTDSFNPTEYRMACFVDGIEIGPINYNTASQFEIKFNCKPQRYLMGGESAISVNDGDVILNPTLFEASPLLEVEGYGTIEFNGFDIEIENATFGNVLLADPINYNSYSQKFIFPTAQYEVGDDIILKNARVRWRVGCSESNNYQLGDTTTSDSGTAATSLAKMYEPAVNRGNHYYDTVVADLPFTAGTYETKTDTITVSAKVLANGSSTVVATETLTPSLSVKYEQYSDTEDAITVQFTPYDATNTSAYPSFYGVDGRPSSAGAVEAISSKTFLGHPTYIDCDLGEVYMIEDDAPISLNQYIDLGSDLPVLASGPNEITFDNTITDLKIVPRWWKV